MRIMLWLLQKSLSFQNSRQIQVDLSLILNLVVFPGCIEKGFIHYLIKMCRNISHQLKEL